MPIIADPLIGLIRIGRNPELMVRRGARGFNVTSMPYEARVYINNQVLVPASLSRALGINHYRNAIITIEYNGFRTQFRVKLLRTRNTDSRQFTIPRSVREAYGIKPLDTVRVVSIEPGNGEKATG
ncbi:AbrB/MazE/SpoVT family DNA-binding domain-containing protein [Vulcanisaeta souniana]|uniref:AbrB family transcriptional regulator n=2 Tax=Vulcanisaeta souniana JCM 11219 TaxID=1293586 RepID=A0A830EKP2_9CREN|nr:AbrB/MazE/SpoVT family DNA-binding domain-containing protein [Vulcanisaeta souniana]GGI86364.1 hypothetical protein GCM10007112_24190 [Vulcanisaeta souniana JCM 11219]